MIPPVIRQQQYPGLMRSQRFSGSKPPDDEYAAYLRHYTTYLPSLCKDQITPEKLLSTFRYLLQEERKPLPWQTADASELPRWYKAGRTFTVRGINQYLTENNIVLNINEALPLIAEQTHQAIQGTLARIKSTALPRPALLAHPEHLKLANDLHAIVNVSAGMDADRINLFLKQLQRWVERVKTDPESILLLSPDGSKSTAEFPAFKFPAT